MNTKHEKSACCSAPVRRYGKRRRQCVQCKKTWRAWKRKRGRKKKRIVPGLINAYFSRRVVAIRDLAYRRQEGKSSSQRALARSLENFIQVNNASWETLVPRHGKLILVADAIWYRVKGKKYTIYVLLLRPRNGDTAVIWPPYLTPGHEDIKGWRLAAATIPAALYARIGAIVCDGGAAVVSLAYRNEWLLQRCHFHLLLALQNYLTTGPRSQQRTFALRVMHLAQTVINDSDDGIVESSLHALDAIRLTTRSRGLRRTLNGLMLHWEEYRTYRTHSDWHLPATSNAAESCINGIRDLMRRCRGFRSEEQLTKWLAAFAIHKKTICCREKNQPN
jgi:hypothetical protein